LLGLLDFFQEAKMKYYKSPI